MKFSIATELGIAMCRQWGIDAAHCTAIDIRWRPNELPTATVELLLTEGVVRELLTLVPAKGVTADE